MSAIGFSIALSLSVRQCGVNAASDQYHISKQMGCKIEFIPQTFISSDARDKLKTIFGQCQPACMVLRVLVHKHGYKTIAYALNKRANKDLKIAQTEQT